MIMLKDTCKLRRMESLSMRLAQVMHEVVYLFFVCCGKVTWLGSMIDVSSCTMSRNLVSDNDNDDDDTHRRCDGVTIQRNNIGVTAVGPTVSKVTLVRQCVEMSAKSGNEKRKANSDEVFCTQGERHRATCPGVIFRQEALASSVDPT